MSQSKFGVRRAIAECAAAQARDVFKCAEACYWETYKGWWRYHLRRAEEARVAYLEWCKASERLEKIQRRYF